MLAFPVAHFGSSGFPPPDVYDLAFGTKITSAAQLTSAGFTFSRTSSAWDSTLTSYASGVPVITASQGLFVEEPRTNLFLNSSAPVTQSIAGLTGTCICWVLGAGTVTLSGGSTGVASAGSPVVFAPSGSVTFTVAGGPPTYVSVEQASFPTLPIVTAGASVTRNTDNCAATSPAWAMTSGTVMVKARSAAGTSGQYILWSVDDGTTSNRIKLDLNASNALRLTIFSGGVQQASVSTGASSFAFSTDATIALAWRAGSYVIRSTVGNNSASLASVPPSMSVERIGAGNGPSTLWNSNIYRVARWSSVLTSAQMDAAIAAA